jgi:hypothetical protein
MRKVQPGINTILHGSLKPTLPELDTHSSFCRVKASIDTLSAHAAFAERFWITCPRSQLILIEEDDYAYWTVVQCRLNDQVAAQMSFERSTAVRLA